MCSVCLYSIVVVDDDISEKWMENQKLLLTDLVSVSQESRDRVEAVTAELNKRSCRQHLCLTFLEQSDSAVC